jgi:hypothetical protein
VSNFRVENPRCRCPVALLIDDPTPCINPLYYFASQVPKNAVDYHYTRKNGKWYFDSDEQFKHPISENVDRAFVHEFASWVDSTDVKGKISVIPYPAGLGRVDQYLEGFPRTQVRDFVSTVKNNVSSKFDVGSELLTHTRALNLGTRKLMNGISEHDWSQSQNEETLARYISFSLEILKRAGLDPSGVTSPCNFGMYAEEAYVRAILHAARDVLDQKVVWYFLNVDVESRIVDHRLMYLDREAGEAVVTMIASMNDPFWTSQISDLDYESWVKERIDPVLSRDGRSGRIPEQIASGSSVTIVTHWQSLYSNGTRNGLKGLSELVSRINDSFADKIVWMKCTEIADYIACRSSLLFRPHQSPKGTFEVDISSPFNCRDLTFSFTASQTPRKITLLTSTDEENSSEKELTKVDRFELLETGCWLAKEDEANGGRRIFVCLEGLSRKIEKTINYGVTRKTRSKIKKVEFILKMKLHTL